LFCFQSNQWIEDRIRCYATIRYRSILLANYFLLVRLSHSPSVLDYSQKPKFRRNTGRVGTGQSLYSLATRYHPKCAAMTGNPASFGTINQ